MKDGTVVAMKVQYPGVANSIDSDIENVKRLLDYTNVIPEGLYLDQAMRVSLEWILKYCKYFKILLLYGGLLLDCMWISELSSNPT